MSPSSRKYTDAELREYVQSLSQSELNTLKSGEGNSAALPEVTVEEENGPGTKTVNPFVFSMLDSVRLGQLVRE